MSVNYLNNIMRVLLYCNALRCAVKDGFVIKALDCDSKDVGSVSSSVIDFLCDLSKSFKLSVSVLQH